MDTTRTYFPATSAQLGTSVSTIYTCPAGKTAEIRKAQATNTTGTGRTISVYLVRSGDSAAAKNLITDAMALTAHNATILTELIGLTLAPGDTIQALADAINAVSPAGSIFEFTPS